MRIKKRDIGTAAVLFMLILTASGCYGDIKDYCETFYSCGVYDNETDQAACEEIYKGERKVAKEYDCKDKFDAMMECWADNISCVDGQLSFSGDCTSKEDALDNCEDSASAIGDLE